MTGRRAVGIAQSAGGLVVGPSGKVLVVNQNGDSWSLPKGHLDPGETALQAARREIAEEAGVTDLQLIGRLGSYVRTRIARGGGEDTTQKKKLTFYFFRTSQTKLRPEDPHNPEARWMAADQAERFLTHPKDRLFFKRAWKNISRKNLNTQVCFWRSPVGAMRLTLEDQCLVRAELTAGTKIPNQPAPVWLANELERAFSGKKRPTLSLDLRGTPFQKRVWKALLRIPRGRTISYASLARKIGRPRAVRAVASAVGANPICVVVPCHRVIGSDGSLGGFAYGPRVKAALLKREGVRL